MAKKSTPFPPTCKPQNRKQPIPRSHLRTEAGLRQAVSFHCPNSFLFIGELVNILYFLLIGLFKYTKAAQCKNLVRYKNMFAYTHTQQNKRRVIIF